jgi:mRNA interferase RelE/StbE
LRVYLSAQAKKSLDSAPTELKARLDSKISELIDTPYPPGCKKLKGAPNSYRLRVGDHRVLYSILPRDEILVFKIASRSSAYD